MKLETTLKLTLRGAFAVTGMFLLAGSSALADNLTWIGPNVANWNTTDLNWNNGSSDVAWTNGNAAIFNGFSSTATVTLSTDIVATSLTRNSSAGTTTMGLLGFSINTASVSTNGGSIDLSSKITGSHDLTLSGSGGGRLNLKVASDYTGDTFINSGAYMLTDKVSNALPVTTTLNMVSGTTFRFAATNITQEIAGLSGGGTFYSTSTNNAATINTKNGVSTSFNGTVSGSTFGITVTGSGTQTLSGTLSYGAATQVSGGTLSLGSNLSGTSSVTVNGGTLSSTGSNANLGVGTVSMSSGTISPRGTGAPGTFTVASNQNFNVTGGNLAMNVGTGTDQILGSGTGIFSLENATIALTMDGGFSYENTYNLLSGFSSGTFNNIAITGYDTANWLADLNSSSGTLSLSFSAVPEPSTWALALGTLMGCLALFRKSRKA